LPIECHCKSGTARVTRALLGQADFEAERHFMGNLLHYAIVFLVVAIVAALFGFGGVAGTAMEGARILFWVAIVLFVVALIGNFVRRA
jgi:uncharacterized membrane protein YtjA (UPF0391 family)